MFPSVLILTTNGIVQECLGASPADIGRAVWDTTLWASSTDEQAKLRDAIGRAAVGESLRYEAEISLPSAGQTRAEIMLAPLRDEQDRVAHIWLEAREVSNAAAVPHNHHLNEAHRQLREANAQLQAIWANSLFASRDPAVGASALLSAIIESSDDAIISKDLNGIIMSWNKSAERLFGYTAEEAIGQPILMLIPPERVDEEPQILERLKRGERVDHFETVRLRKDGSRLNLSLTISPVKDAEGTIFGASKIARDITERVRQQAALEEANTALERANADLQQFAYSASHDLQEPLRMVISFSELLGKAFASRLGPTGEEYLRHIVEGATRMDNLLRDLRAYTQASTADSPPAEQIDAGEVLKTTLLNLEAAIQESGASVTSTALPRIYMHQFQLEQLLQNLISNAIRYRRTEPPCIQISARPRGQAWLFSVQDNGIGIEPEFREQIFGIFKRLHSSAEYPGTGMGLAICQRVIERVGGRIWVESEVGRGSTFFFTVPMRKPTDETAEPARAFSSSR